MFEARTESKVESDAIYRTMRPDVPSGARAGGADAGCAYRKFGRVHNQTVNRKGGFGFRLTGCCFSSLGFLLGNIRMSACAQMRIFEFARVLQAGSERSIQTYVSHPDQRKQQCCTVICRNPIRSQKDWPDIRVDGVVEQRSDPGICKIPDHRNVWEEKE